MKKSILIIALLAGFQAVAQETGVEKVTSIESYASQLSEMQISNPGKFELVQKYGDHKLTIIERINDPKNLQVVAEIPLRKKGTSLTIAEFLILSKEENFNPYILAWFPSIERQYFRLEGTDFLVVIPSQKDLNQKR